uniref:Phytocyanin domain-containing protein n=1 Tax=Ananas comosus var. bracteatus TaxID=296719 RepID=A0A6V7PTC7_ANACO|nr:unnamed protein product [Ananas comosus var. bracteatus]
MAKAHVMLLFLSAFTIGCLVVGSMAHKDHIVGGSKGWRLPPNQTFYQEWAQTRNFSLGDKLLFPFRSSVYNIMEVSKEDFDACTQKNVTQRFHAGPAIVELTEPGPHYYYCGIGLHCEAGQKLSIDVAATPAVDDASSSATMTGPTTAAPVTGFLVYLLFSLFM